MGLPVPLTGLLGSDSLRGSQGFDSLRALRVATEADLLGAGMKRGHARLLMAELAAKGGAPAWTAPAVVTAPAPAVATAPAPLADSAGALAKGPASASANATDRAVAAAVAVGSLVWALNIKYSDGTRLRSGPDNNADFNGVWAPNDTR